MEKFRKNKLKFQEKFLEKMHIFPKTCQLMVCVTKWAAMSRMFDRLNWMAFDYFLRFFLTIGSCPKFPNFFENFLKKWKKFGWLFSIIDKVSSFQRKSLKISQQNLSKPIFGKFRTYFDDLNIKSNNFGSA